MPSYAATATPTTGTAALLVLTLAAVTLCYPPMSQPRRIQRRRTRGWRMPANTVYVGRPTKWGNPWGIDKTRGSRAGAVRLFQLWLTDRRPDLLDAARRDLAGRDLACWCPLDQPCHADVLLAIANTRETP